MVGEEKCSFVVKHLGDSDQSPVASENLYFRLALINCLTCRRFVCQVCMCGGNFPITSVTLTTLSEIYYELG